MEIIKKGVGGFLPLWAQVTNGLFYVKKKKVDTKVKIRLWVRVRG